MKLLPLIFSLLLVSLLGCDQRPSSIVNENKPAEIKHIILLRHAEKANDGTEDPPLLPEGYQRAEKLVSLFQDVAISKVYTTKYQRCSLTIAPISLAKNLEPTLFSVDDLLAFSKELRNAPDKYILICGHSNTNPALINLLIEEQKFEEIPSSEYDGIYWVQVGEGIQPQVTILRY